ESTRIFTIKELRLLRGKVRKKYIIDFCNIHFTIPKNIILNFGIYLAMLNFLPKNYKTIIRLAFPIILANASAPLLGLADTAAIGQTGDAIDLGGMALATLVFSFVYWGFGFLRMGTTGFIAQARG